MIAIAPGVCCSAGHQLWLAQNPMGRGVKGPSRIRKGGNPAGMRNKPPSRTMKAEGVKKHRTQIPKMSQRTVVGDSVLDNQARPRKTDGNAYAALRVVSKTSAQEPR